MMRWFILFLLTITRYSNLDQQCGIIHTGQEWINLVSWVLRRHSQAWNMGWDGHTHWLTSENWFRWNCITSITEPPPSPNKRSKSIPAWRNVELISLPTLDLDIETHLFDNSSGMVPSVSTDLWGDRYPPLTISPHNKLISFLSPKLDTWIWRRGWRLQSSQYQVLDSRLYFL